MTIHAHVRELLRFEEQRLAIAIDCSTSDEQPSSTTSVVVRLPHPDGLTRLVEVVGCDDRRWSLHVASLMTGEPACVLDTSGPVPVASVEANVVRLGFDPNALAGDSDRALLTHLWDAAVAPALGKAAQNAQALADTSQVEAFARLEERWHRETLSRLPSAIENNEYQLTRLESQMRDLIQKTDDLRRQERALHVVGHASQRDAARQQWTAIRRLVPEVYRAVELRGTILVALTRIITIEHEDVSVDVGEFEINVDVVAGELSVRNRTNTVEGGAHHPHVREPGSPCWGNLHAGVTRLLAEREWAGLLAVVHRFLHAYNDRDAYVKLEAWDPNHHDSDDEDYDDEDAEDETVECSICFEQTASDEITHVQDEPVCLACWERDTHACGGCSGRFLSRNLAPESLRCRRCVPAPTASTSQEVAS